MEDPSGLLERVPEIEPFMSVPGVRRALAAGRPGSAYRALHWARLVRRVPKELRPACDAVLARRRPFVEPMKGSPSLMTFNGIGIRPHGEQERGDDGGFILTTYLVILFLPLVPLASYLVKPADQGWYFLGRVPLGRIATLWRASAGLLAMLAAFAGIGSAISRTTHGTAWFVNGTPAAVQVHVGEKELRLRPNDPVAISVELPLGTYEVTTTVDDGTVIERGTLEIENGPDARIWNVLGAAIIVRHSVFYGDREPGLPFPEPDARCGQSLVVIDEADYVLRDPPESLQVRAGQVLAKSVVSLQPDLEACVGMLASRGEAADALRVARGVSEALGRPPELVGLVVGVAIRTGDEDLAATEARAAIAAAPDDLEAHRFYQQVLLRTGHRDELRSEYEKRLGERPDSADAAYLLARLLPDDEAASLSERTLAAHPDHVPSMRTQAWIAYRARDWERAAALLARIAGAGPLEAATVLDMRVRALVAAGHADEAAAVAAASAAAEQDPGKRNDLAVLQSRIARGAGGTDPLAFWDDMPPAWRDSRPTHLLRAHRDAGDEPIPGDDRYAHAAPLLRNVMTHPDKALEVAATCEPAVIAALDEESHVLLYAEACRRDAGGGAAQALGALMEGGPAVAAAMAEFVATGARSAEFDDVRPESMAGLLLARSRVTSLPPQEREALRQEALALDNLHDTATLAALQWPAPQ